MRPLLPDGRTFYYSDYNFKGRKVYRKTQHWSCCSGTLPQVAADYRISTYFHHDSGLWVNLYIPSTLQCRRDAEITLTQKGNYPFDEFVTFELQTSKPVKFALRLRIPAWAHGASVSINGRRVPEQPDPGTFAVIEREWKSGDHIDLELPMTLRLEPIDADHENTAALLSGPIVRLPITKHPLSIPRAELLAAKRAGQAAWHLQASGKTHKLLPFIEIADEHYSTYSSLT